MSPMRRIAFLLLLLPAACDLQQDPLEKAGTWKPVGANEANLRVMIADPADLAGRPIARTQPANVAVNAIDRLLADKVKPLAVTNTSSVGGGSGGSSAGQ